MENYGDVLELYSPEDAGFDLEPDFDDPESAWSLENQVGDVLDRVEAQSAEEDAWATDRTLEFESGSWVA